MTTKIEKRAIPPPTGDLRATVQGLFVQTNELSGAIGANAQRAVRVCELLDAGVISLDVDGALVKPVPAAAAGPTPGLYVEKAGDTMTGTLTNTAQDYLVSSRSGYAFSHFNFGNGQFGVYDQTAVASAWLYNTAAGGIHDLRGAVNVTGNLGVGGYIQAGNGASGWKVAIGDDTVLADIGVAHALSIQSQSNSAFGRLWLGTRQTFDNDGDGWLRLNQSNSYANGVYTPGAFRVGGQANFESLVRVTNQIHMAGNGKTIKFFDNNLDTALEIGIGYFTATDRHGWINNRNASGFMAISGRNGSCELRLGSSSNASTITGTLTSDMEVRSIGTASGFVFSDRTTTSDVWVWYSQGGLARLYRNGIGDLFTFNTSGIATGTNFVATSDERLKHAFQKQAPAEGLSTLQLYDYLWNRDGSPGRGPIAQHVQQVAPAYVHQDPDTGMLSVDKAGLALEAALLALSQIKEIRHAAHLSSPAR